MPFNIKQTSDPSQKALEQDFVDIFSSADEILGGKFERFSDVDAGWSKIDQLFNSGEQHSQDSEIVQEALAKAVRDASLQRLIGGKNNILSIEYLEIGLITKGAVGKLYLDALNESGSCTHVGQNIIITNHHVIQSKARAKAFELQMGFEHDRHDAPSERVYYKLDPEKLFITDAGLDYSLIAVKTDGKPDIGKVFGTNIPDTKPRMLSAGDPLVIIHHPGGKEKSISIHDNSYVELPDSGTFAGYTGDTLKGSSGAPVFDNKWRFVALHRQGRVKTNEEGEFLKKDGTTFLDQDDFRKNEHLAWWECNLGTWSYRLVEHLKRNIPASEKQANQLESLLNSWAKNSS